MKAWENPEWREKFFALYAQGLTDVPTAAALGCHRETVCRARHALKLFSNAGNPGPNVSALLAESRYGHCVVCDARLPGNGGKLCGEAECKRVLHRAWRRDWSLKQPGRHRANQRAWQAKQAEGRAA